MSRIHGRQQAVRLERPAFPRRLALDNTSDPDFWIRTFEPAHREDADSSITLERLRLRPPNQTWTALPVLIRTSRRTTAGVRYEQVDNALNLSFSPSMISSTQQPPIVVVRVDALLDFSQIGHEIDTLPTFGHGKADSTMRCRNIFILS